MVISGADYLKNEISQGDFTAKMVFNEQGALIFSVRTQHSHAKAPGISYEHESAGNAVAAMLLPNKIEVRFHQRFSDERIAHLLMKLLSEPELSEMANWEITYQGRPIHLPNSGNL